MSNKFSWIAVFSVDPNISKTFQDWMEEEHFQDLHETGHFEKKVKKIFQPGINNGEMDTISYIHKPLSEESWKKYCENERDELKKDFGKNWGSHFNDGTLKALQVAGELVSLE